MDGRNISPLAPFIEHHIPRVARQLVALLGDSERERDSKANPIAQLVIQGECLLTLISWWMLCYLLLPLWRKEIRHLQICSLSHPWNEIVIFSLLFVGDFFHASF